VGQPTDHPLATVSASGTHHAEVRALLTRYVDQEKAEMSELDLKGLGVVQIEGEPYVIVDIGLRMLTPRELFRAQGFTDRYVIDEVPDWDLLFDKDGRQVAGDPLLLPKRKLTQTEQVRMVGNRVYHQMSYALVMANFTHEKAMHEAPERAPRPTPSRTAAVHATNASTRPARLSRRRVTADAEAMVV
jgi:DNA (cytosine-5)-methyltransferase 1